MEKEICRHQKICTVKFENLMIGTWWEAGPHKIGLFGTDCILYKTCYKQKQVTQESEVMVESSIKKYLNTIPFRLREPKAPDVLPEEL